MNCAHCGEKITEQYYSFTDNFLQVKYFDEQDGSDNIFCSTACAAAALMLECFPIEETETMDDEDDT